MDRKEALERLVASYGRYYNVKTEDPTEPFAAEAEFHTHDEQYFLFKSAKLSEMDAAEIVFFASVEELTEETYRELDGIAWETGLSRVHAGPGHRRTDISLVILADRMDGACPKMIRKQRRSVSYKFGFHGYTHYRVVAYDLTDGTIARNAMGEPLEKTIRNIFLAK